MVTELDPQDAKLVTLARASMARIGAKQGAAVRDLDGRSYASGPVDLPSLSVGALELAVAQAVAAGATGLEAVAVVSVQDDAIVNLAVVRDLGGEGVPVHLADAKGDVVRVLTS
jgi:hypothetical protein